MEDRAAQARARLAALARTTELHVEAEEGRPLSGGPEDLARLDHLINARLGDRPESEIRNLGPCYGAWLGERIAREFGGCWIGVLEPAAPRLAVAGRVISPIDAVTRRLVTGAGPTLTRMFEQVRSWSGSAPERDRILETNRKAWDALTASPRFTGVALELLERESALEALDPWITEEGLDGRRVLCLGAGGGRQGPLHAAAGAAEVVVVDLSDAQLELDRKLAREHRLNLRTIRTSMDDLSALQDGSFHVVIQPVSSSYVPDLDRVHREVARVLGKGGLYVAQHKQPASLQADAGPPYGVNRPYVEGAALETDSGRHREEGCVEFLHTLEGLIGGLCRAGFVIEDVVEPPLADALAEAGTFEHRAAVLPPYLKIKARRR